MRIVEFIPRELVHPELAAADKDAALAELATLMAERADLPRQQVLDVWIEREKLASTGIGEGVAIPHGKLPGMKSLVAALARSRKGVDFDSLDGGPAHLFFALVAPESSTGLHLKALARISRLLKDPDFRLRLMQAADADEMYRILLEEDSKY